MPENPPTVQALLNEYRAHQPLLTPYKTCRAPGCTDRPCARGAEARRTLLAMGIDPGHPDNPNLPPA